MNRKMLARIMMLVCLMGSCLMTFAQSVITGKVSDDKGQPLSGVSVTVKGTNNGTSTSVDGTYRISASGNATIVFSFVGYNKKEVASAGNSTIDVTLSQLNDQMSEVVVVGYGTARKKDLTGAVSQVSAKSFNQGPIAGPDQLIQGKVAGLQVISNNGQPGAATTVRIRGNASVRSGAGQPLYVIDGVALDGRNARPALSALGLGTTADIDPMLFINTGDIESVQVLKDASAAAIYGSRGANGVILIQTKKGSGAPKLDFSYQTGVSSVIKKYGVLDASGYKAALSKYGLTTGDFGSSVDAQDAIFRKGGSQNVNLAVSGGSATSNYRLSIGYFGVKGVVIGSDLKKYVANFVGQSKLLSDKLTLDYALNFGQVNENIAPVSEDAGFEGSLIGNALQWNPTRAFKNSDGTWNQPSGALNPLALDAAYDDRTALTNGGGRLAGTFKLTHNLDFKVMGSATRQTGERKTSMQAFLNQNDILNRGWGFAANNELTSLLGNATLNYRGTFNNLKLDALAGYEFFKSDRKGFSAFGKDFKDIPVNYANIIQYASQSSLANSSFYDPSWELQSYFARAAFNYLDKYYLTGTIRADGSSKFGSSNKYGYFPSFAAGWNISNEDFLKNSNLITNLKLRIGYGVTGSQEFPSGAAQDQYTFTQQSFVLSNVANPNLKWEKEKQTNVGVDFTLMKNINGSIDFFKKDRTNLLFNTQVTLPGPATRYWVNVPADIVNTGVELTLNADVIKKGNFYWNLGGNATFLKNTLENFNFGTVLTGVLSGQGMTEQRVQKLINGKPINAFYLLDFAGFDASGNTIFGKNSEKSYAGNPNPTTLLGIRSEMGFDKFTLTINGYGLYGQKIYNNTANATVGLGNLGKGNVDKRFINTGESPGNAPTPSTRYLESGNFFRLSNATLNYNLGNIGSIMKNLNIFLTGNNLFVITKYHGFDPEVNTNKALNGVASQGIEYTPYPSARSFLLGVRVSF